MGLKTFYFLMKWSGYVEVEKIGTEFTISIMNKSVKIAEKKLMPVTERYTEDSVKLPEIDIVGGNIVVHDDVPKIARLLIDEGGADKVRFVLIDDFVEIDAYDVKKVKITKDQQLVFPNGETIDLEDSQVILDSQTLVILAPAYKDLPGDIRPLSEKR